jgi:16S rRNA (adenine1518-N6/adenine1519-N6)-dimethyltransferase
MQENPEKRHRPRKSLGQHFLVSEEISRKIIKAAEIKPSDLVIEIGPGQGALTKWLIETGAEVFALEADSELYNVLNEKFAFASNFQLVNADALKFDYSSFIGNRKAVLVSNLPYNISSPILRLFAGRREHFLRLVLMLQKEVVERVTAPASSSNRGFLTVLCEEAFVIKKLFDVAPGSFFPRPKILSTVACFKPKEKTISDYQKFEGLLSKAFSQPRKTLLNNLKNGFSNAQELLAAAGINPKRRPETLTLNEWINLLHLSEESAAFPIK